MKIMKIELYGNNFSSNCYILTNENKALVIDPGFEDNNLYNYLNSNNLEVESILLTHGHFDHWGGLAKLRKIYPNATLYASSLDDTWYMLSNNNPYGYVPKIDVDLKNLKEIKLLDETFKIFKLPGHSLGSIGLYKKGFLIAGDVLFFRSIGRTDLIEGSYETLVKSIKMIYTLDNNTIIYPGHGRPTTVLEEKTNNPFVRG